MTEFLEELFRRQRAAQRPEMPIGEADNYGRFGDTLLAHISQSEAQKLKSEGGSGTRNPVTGLLEFFDAMGGSDPPGAPGGGPGSGQGAGGIGGPGGGPGGGGGPGRGDPGFGTGGAASAGAAIGRAGGSLGVGASTDTGPDPIGRGAPGRGGVSPVGTDTGPQGTTAPETEQGFVDSLLDALGLTDVSLQDVAQGVLGIASALSPTVGLAASPLGLAASVHDAAKVAGVGATSLGVAGDPGPLDLSGEDTTQGVGSADPGAVTGSDPAAFGGKGGAAGGPGGGGQITDPPPPPPPGPEPIPILEEPASLRLSSAMTPLQKRATIATFGTGAESGRFREPDVQNFYKNFLLRNLLDKPDSPFLPVEAQFANQVLGLDVSTDTPRSELLTLLGNPAPPTPPEAPAIPPRTLAEGLAPGQARYA